MLQTILETQKASSDPVVIVEKIASRSSEEQREATRALESGDPAYFEALLEILERENRKKIPRFAVALIIVCVCGTLLLEGLSQLFHIRASGLIGGLCGVFAGIAASFAPSRLQKSAAERVAQSEDIRAVGPLLETFSRQDEGTQKITARALERLLPRMKYSDSHLLDDHQRGMLLVGLKTKDRRFKMAVLKSLPQIGDKRFLKPIAALAEGKGAGKKDMELRDEAAACLKGLKARIEDDATRLSLLRPVECPTEPGNALLRPAGSSQSEPQSLLRAVEPTETES